MKNNKGIAHLFLLVIVIFIAIGAIGYLAYQNAQLKRQTEDTTAPPESLVTLTPTPDPTANWKLYKHNALGFSIRYPQDMVLQEYSTEDSGPDLSGQFRTATLKQKASTRDYSFEILITYFESNLDIDKWYLNNYPKLVNPDDEVSKSDITLNGVTALRHSRKNPSLFPNYTSDEVFLTHKGKVISIIGSSIADYDEQKTFNQILSTFKFTDETNETTSTPKPTPVNQTWKGLGVSFSYPSNWSANKPVSTVQKPQVGGWYQQSFESKVHYNSMGLRVAPREKNADGSYKSLEEQYQHQNIKKTTVAGKDGVVGQDSIGSSHQLFLATLLNDEMTVSLLFFAQKSTPESINALETVFNQIHSTFKILE